MLQEYISLYAFPSLDVGERDGVITNEKSKSQGERTKLKRKKY